MPPVPTVVQIAAPERAPPRASRARAFPPAELAWLNDRPDVRGRPGRAAAAVPAAYGVTATSVAAVNRAKGRPEEQPAGVIVDDFEEVTRFSPSSRVSPG